MNKKMYIAVICTFSLLLTVSSGFLIKHYIDSEKQAEMYDNLIETVEKTDTEKNTMTYSQDKSFLSDYQDLYLQNNDMVGWIKIEDTKINYPVMQSKDNPNFYLKHGFDKAYTDYGCPYVQENCDVDIPSDNLIIYGHNMKDSSMFSGLMKHTEKSFWESHKTIRFDTLTEKCNYEVIAVFKTVVYTDSPESFKYYQFVNADTADEFNAYITKCKELALYDTGVTAEYGDKLITLSTCEYSRNNGRMVVVAKKMAEYHWSYEVDPESHVSWMSPELFSGETNDDSNRFLECCGEALNRGIDTDDSKLVFEAVRLCMDWAGAFYDFRHGPQKGNETVVKKLFDDGTIVEFMRKSREYILSGNIESLEYYTSGWAIVWYVLDPDKMIILGSREVCGLNKILIDFKKEYNIEKLPREINFGQLVYRDNKRFIEGIKYVYTPKGKLKMYKKILKILNTVKDLGGYACCHEIDRKLFMIGR